MQKKEDNVATVCIRGQDGAGQEDDDNINLESWTVLDTTVVIQPNANVNRAQALVDFIRNDKSYLDTSKEKLLSSELVQLATLPETSDLILGCFGTFFKRIQTPEIVSAMADQLYDLFVTQNQPLAVTALKTIITDIPAVDFIRPHLSHKETRMIMSLIDSLVPRLVGGISKDNITSTLELVGMMLRLHSYFFRNHPKHRNIHFWDNYFCTGIELGKGSYASVYLGRHVKTAKIVAIKSMQWDKLTQGKPKLEEQLRNEIEIMKASNHPNIVKLYDVVRDGGVMNLILEYCGGGSLEEHLKAKGVLTEQETLYWLKELGLGLKFLRDRGIIHRDLKPGNLLIANEGGVAHLKITDFTFARLIEPGDLATTLVGTPLYMAPEIFEDHRYTDKADLWSIGVIVYQMLTGHIPFSAARAQNYVELINLIKRNELILPPNISPNMKDLMVSLLQKSANLRSSWTEFFVHPCLGMGTMSGSDRAISVSGDSDVIHELEQARIELDKLRAKEKLDAETIEGLRAQAVDTARRADEARKEAERLRAEIERYKQIDGDWIKQLDREQRISANLDKEVAVWRERATEGEIALQKLRVEHQAELAALRTALAAAKGKQEDADSKARLENDLRLARSDNELLRDENKRLREQLAQAKQASGGMSAQTMETLEAMMETWQKEKDRDAQARDDLLRMYEAQLKQKDRQIDDLTEELAVLRISMEAEANEHGLKNSFYKVTRGGQKQQQQPPPQGQPATSSPSTTTATSSSPAASASNNRNKNNKN